MDGVSAYVPNSSLLDHIRKGSPLRSKMAAGWTCAYRWKLVGSSSGPDDGLGGVVPCLGPGTTRTSQLQVRVLVDLSDDKASWESETGPDEYCTLPRS